ncbi:fungal-specific transcription factor domain-containing protein [Xylogone sp. PMI_703]|nr:fungal-specific transcription factor domain-containing protein [Xylogone sp. PMI_703]
MIMGYNPPRPRNPSTLTITKLTPCTTEKTSLACDVCRVRKIKCDRELPCERCRISFHDCVYSDPSRKRKRRTRTLDKVKVLENRLLELEREVKSYTSSPGASKDAPFPVENRLSNGSGARHDLKKGENSLNQPNPIPDSYASTQHDIAQGEEFQGSSAERAFMQQVKAKLQESSGMDINLWPRVNTPTSRLFQNGYEVIQEACHPTKERAQQLINACFETYALFSIVHRPTFDASFHLIYSLRPREYSMKEVEFIPLVYAVMALGCMAIVDVEVAGYEELVSEGERYFTASRCLADLENSTSLTNLQAIIYMNLYLACTARISTCYSHLSLTVSLAVRMGLHRSLSKVGDYIEQETRKRMFWTVKLLSDYMAVACGMPKMLSDDDIDQEMPVEVNDIYIEKAKIHQQPREELRIAAGVNAYTRLHLILAKVIRHIYPSKGLKRNRAKAPFTYMVNMTQVQEIGDDLRHWVDSIPKGFKLGRDVASPSRLRSQYMVCITYAHVQLMLYRPFLHYLSRSREDGTNISDNNYSAYAMACIRASHNIIHLSEDMWKRGFVIGTKWMATNIMIGAIFTLIYVFLDGGGTENIIQDVIIGNRILEKLGRYHPGAERCRTILAVLVASFSNEHQYIKKRLQEAEREGSSSSFNSNLQDNHSCDDDMYTSSLGDNTFTMLSSPPQSTDVNQIRNLQHLKSQSSQQITRESAETAYHTADNNTEPVNSLYPYVSPSPDMTADQSTISSDTGTGTAYGCIMAWPFNSLLGQQVSREGNPSARNATDINIEDLLHSADLDFGQIGASFGF